MVARIAGCLAIGLVLAAGDLPAQAVAFRLSAVDMFGGAVLPAESDPGVAFGARVGLLDLFARSVQAGLEFEWWTAERQDAELEVRDIVFGLTFLSELSRTGPLRPYLGLNAALHSVDTSRPGGERFLDGEPAAAERISGYRAGGGVVAGLALRLTRTGAIWLLVEYRYTAVARVAHHELRGGARLLTARR
ncbi:MAG: opacity family porin [Gemmatimonadales bacterium]